MKNYDELIRRCDESIRAGKPHEARRLLSRLNPRSVLRAWRLPLAKICRRAGALSLGLRLLDRIVWPQSKLENPASDAERAEYAVLLQRNGALAEALEILKGIPGGEVPESLLYRSFIHFAQWEFEDAIPLLKSYLETDLVEHARSVGSLNLAFALVESRRHEEALEILDSFLGCHRGQMFSNGLALKGQVYLQQGAFALARKELDRARESVANANTNDQFFAVKNGLILQGLEKGDLAAFERLRELAAQNRAWESVREADFYTLKVRFEESRYLHLYSGSPYPGFREFLRSEFGAPKASVYLLGQGPHMNLNTGKMEFKEIMTAGHKPHRLVAVLLRDFYRPLRVGGIFSELFPEEHFNPSSSVHRVHQLISRTRRLFEESQIPVRVHEDKGFYSVKIEGPFGFAIPLERFDVSLTKLQMEQLRSLFQDRAFSVQEAVHTLGISQASAYRLISTALHSGELEKMKPFGRASTYRVARATAIKKAC